MNKLYIMCALRSLVILTIRVTYLFSTCPLKLLDCQASIASEENVIVILLFGVLLCILSPVLRCCAFSSTPASVVRLTGAGDCLVGGMLASICAGLNLMQSVAVGIATAKAAIEAKTSVPTAFSLASIARKTEVGVVIGVAGKD